MYLMHRNFLKVRQTSWPIGTYFNRFNSILSKKTRLSQVILGKQSCSRTLSHVHLPEIIFGSEFGDAMSDIIRIL